MAAAQSYAIRFRVTGMDCSACAAKIEKATRALSGVENVHVSVASGEMTVDADDPHARAAEIERVVGSGCRSLAVQHTEILLIYRSGIAR